MNRESIFYFKKPDPQNTFAVIELIKRAALEINTEAVIITSTSGKTGLEAAKAVNGNGIRLIIVPFQKHIADKHDWHVNANLKMQCLEAGALFLPDEPYCMLLDDERNDLVRGWYSMGQGFKVALQVASMCVDTGLISEGSTVISSGGTANGADTAVLIKAFCTKNAQKNRVIKIIAMVEE